jgi:hypothetical protein
MSDYYTLFWFEVRPCLVRSLILSFNLRRRSSCEAMSASSNPLADSSADLRSISYNRSLNPNARSGVTLNFNKENKSKEKLFQIENFWENWITVFRIIFSEVLCRDVKCRYD